MITFSLVYYLLQGSVRPAIIEYLSNIRFGANAIKLFTAVIYEFLYLAKVFVRLGWKSFPGTNTLAYYEYS
jgi:hypothetical protein